MTRVFSVYPRRIEFDELPAGVQSAPVWVHLANYDPIGSIPSFPVEDWGINGHFTSQRPRLKALEAIAVNHIKTTPPPSSTSEYIISDEKYVYESSSAGIRVFKLDSAGALSLVSTRSNVVAVQNMYHDGRFLYVAADSGLNIFKVDPFGNLILKDVIKPNGSIPLSVSGFGKYIFHGDGIGLTVLKVDHNGQATIIDSKSINAFGVFARKDFVFVVDNLAPELQVYGVDAAGKLTVLTSHSFSNSSSLITGDQDYIYVFTERDIKVWSLSYDPRADAISVNDNLVLSLDNSYQLFWDGAYVLVAGRIVDSFSLIGVDRSDGSLSLVRTVNDNTLSIWSNGEIILTARLSTGMSVYDFNDSRIRFPVHFTPLGYEKLTGEMIVQDVPIIIEGSSPASFDPYIRAGSTSRTLISDLRWDRVAFDWFGNYDRTQDVKNHNLMIPTEIKARLYIPTGAILEQPGAVENDNSVIGAAGWRRQ